MDDYKPIMSLDEEVVAFGKVKECYLDSPQSHTFLGETEYIYESKEAIYGNMDLKLTRRRQFGMKPKYKPFPGWNSKD